MFERFTDRARRVVVMSQEEARRLKHSYIGTEHILLGLLGEREGLAGQALTSLGMTLEGTRQEVAEVVAPGSAELTSHIPFTPRAKKTLELSLREALQLQHDYIGTEHLLLGLIAEGERADKDEGVGVKILRRHAELPAIRTAVLNLLPAAGPESAHARRWRRARSAGIAELVLAGEGARSAREQVLLNATPAADTTLSEAAKLAGAHPVGSHHLLLAAIADPASAAARALTLLGVNLGHAREALRDIDVTGTSDELPEEAGRRRMVIHVTADRLTLEAADPVLVKAANEALAALGDRVREPGTIPGDLPASASLSRAWQALLESLQDVKQRATSSAEPPAGPSAEPPAGSPAGASAGPPAEPAAGPSAGASADGPDAPDSVTGA